MAVSDSGKDLIRLNRVRRHQQALFVSNICGAPGSSLDERYLRKPPSAEQWSTLNFPIEKPAAKDFRLWNVAIRHVIPPAGLAVRLGKFLHAGYKKREWRLQESEGHLLHAHSGVMDVYVPSSQSGRWWKKALSGCDVQDLGQPCSVRESTKNRVAIVSMAPTTIQESLPETFLDVLCE